ncbi:transposase [mine drainage metagenome]|uniref:Transposase n=1 Tax=mine drainage metagenome TaxID=410659 RepID=T0ZHL9_9ZZZZ
MHEFVSALDTYMRWHNEARIKISLGSRSPIEYRRTMGSAEYQSKFFAAPPPDQRRIGANNGPLRPRIIG